jgi:hypothetical protein
MGVLLYLTLAEQIDIRQKDYIGVDIRGLRTTGKTEHCCDARGLIEEGTVENVASDHRNRSNAHADTPLRFVGHFQPGQIVLGVRYVEFHQPGRQGMAIRAREVE